MQSYANFVQFYIEQTEPASKFLLILRLKENIPAELILKCAVMCIVYCIFDAGLLTFSTDTDLFTASSCFGVENREQVKTAPMTSAWSFYGDHWNTLDTGTPFRHLCIRSMQARCTVQYEDNSMLAHMLMMLKSIQMRPGELLKKQMFWFYRLETLV